MSPNELARTVIEIGDIYKKRGLPEVYVTRVDVTDNATYIYVLDEKGVEKAYGKKAFLATYNKK